MSLKYAKIFATDTPEANRYKNNIIANALISILYSQNTTRQKKDDIFTIIDTCHTKEFNFDSEQITKSLRNMPGAEEIIQNEQVNDFMRLIPFFMIPLTAMYVIYPIDLFPGPVDDIIVFLANSYLFKKTGVKFNFKRSK